MTENRASRLNIARVALAGAAAAAALYFVCWLGAFLSIGPATHLYLQLFTATDTGTTLALVQGLCWSLAFGFVAGALYSLFYNAFAAMDRSLR